MKKQRKNAGSILRMVVALSLAATLLPLPAYAKTHYGGTHSSPNEARGTLEDLETSLRQPPDSEQLFKDARSDAREQSDSSNNSESNATDDDPEEESPDSLSQEDAEAANEATTAQENERTTRHCSTSTTTIKITLTKATIKKKTRPSILSFCSW